MKNLGAGIPVAATYGFTGFLITTSPESGGLRLVLVIFAAICTWKLVTKSD